MKLHKYLFIAAGLALTAGFTACDGGGLDYEYTPAATPTGAQVYFSQDDAGLEVNLSANQTEVEIPVYRVTDDEDITVNITLTDESGLLTLPSTVSFTKGQKQTSVILGVNFDAITANTDYPFTISIAADDASLYGISSLNGTVKYAPWTEWTKLGQGTYEYSLFFSGDDPGLEVMWRESLVDDTKVQFQILHVFYDVTMTIDGTKMQYSNGDPVYVLTIPAQGIGYVHSTYNEEVMIADIYTYTGNSKYQYYSTFDPKTGTFELALVYHISLGIFNNGYEYFQLDGYTSYKIDLADMGHYIDSNGTDYAVVQCHLSDGVASAKYTAVSGTLSDSEVSTVVSGILDGSVESAETSESNGYLTFSLPEKGMYTVIVVGLDEEGNQVCTATLSLAYVPVGSNTTSIDDDPDWTTLGYCSYTEGILSGLSSSLPVETFDVKIQQSKESSQYYRLVNVYGLEGYGFTFDDATENYFLHFLVLDSNGNTILPNLDAQGITPFSNLGAFYTWSYGGRALQNGSTTAEVIASGNCGTLESGFLTFPVKTLYAGFVDSSTNNISLYYGNINGDFEIDMSQVSSAQSSKRRAAAHRTSIKSKVRVYGNPVSNYTIQKKSFIGNVKTKEIIAYKNKHLQQGIR